MKISSGLHPGMTMDTDSAAFHHFLDWMTANGAPIPAIIEGEAIGFGGKGPDMFQFEMNGRTALHTALDFYLTPSVSLTELQKELNFGNPWIAIAYPPYVPPVTTLPLIKPFVDKQIPGRPGYWSVTDVWQGYVKFGEMGTAPNGKPVLLVDEGGPFNRTGVWKEVDE